MADLKQSPNPPSVPTAPADAPQFVGPTPPISSLEHIFAGPEGLRPGWRLLVYLFLVSVLFFVEQVALSSLRGLGWLRLLFLDKLFFALEVTVPAVLMAHTEQRPFRVYGLRPRGILSKDFWLGISWGIGAVTFLVLLLRVFNAYDYGSIALHGPRLLKFALFWSAFFLLVAVSEEFLLRGYTQFTLTDAIGFWPAAILLSLMFGAIHIGNQGETTMGILGAAIIGFFFCLTLRRTGNLWFAVGFHAAWDWGESYLYSVPDSGSLTPGHLLRSSLHGSHWITGGTAGPEGGILLFLVIAALWIAFNRLYPQAKYPA